MTRCSTYCSEYSAYDMSLGSDLVRKPDARVFLPSEDEWYKAAYYDARLESEGGPPGDDHYWFYPTKSDTIPTAEAPPGTDFVNGSANYDSVLGDLTDVGAYPAKPSDSAYGTFDQAGNVWEVNEFAIDFARGGVRGGSFYSNQEALHASYRCCDVMPDPPLEVEYVGFRIAGSCLFTDADGDGDIDLADFRVFQSCFCGPSE